MSRENVELVRGWIDRWNHGRRRLEPDELHPDATLISRFRPEPYRGAAGFDEWTHEIEQQFDEWRIAIDDWRSTGDVVVALGQIHIRSRSAQVQLDEPAAAVIEVRDRKLFSLQMFGNHAEALAAVGLAPE
jgi:hypothetical protein